MAIACIVNGKNASAINSTWSPHFQSTPRTTRVPILSLAANSGPETGKGVFGRLVWPVSSTAYNSAWDAVRTTSVATDDDGLSVSESTAVTSTQTFQVMLHKNRINVYDIVIFEERNVKCSNMFYS